MRLSSSFPMDVKRKRENDVFESSNVSRIKRLAYEAYVGRAQALDLLHLKQTGKALFAEKCAKEIQKLRLLKNRLVTACEYNDIDAYMTDPRLDDFMAYKQIADEFETTMERIRNLESNKPEERWDAQVSSLQPDYAGSLAILNQITDNVEENFLIDPERCQCGRLYRFHPTLSMNFCYVHKIYRPVLSGGDDRHITKVKQAPNNNKQHRLVITSQNEIIAAKNPLYKQRLGPIVDAMVRLTSRNDKARAEATKRLKTQVVKKRKNEESKKEIVKTTKRPKSEKIVKPPKKRKLPKPSKKTKSPATKKTKSANIVIEKKESVTTNDCKHPVQEPEQKKQDIVSQAIADKNEPRPKRKYTKKSDRFFLNRVIDASLASKDSIVPPATSKRDAKPPQLFGKKQQLIQKKGLEMYDKYLLQFAPDAPPLPDALLREIHEAISSLYLFGESRYVSEITKVIASKAEYAPFRFHILRILKLCRGSPIPIIDNNLRERLLERYKQIYVHILAQTGETEKTKRKFIPCEESLTHIFLLSEHRTDLANAFLIHSTVKATPESIYRFRLLIDAVSQTSKLTWCYDYPLHTDA